MVETVFGRRLYLSTSRAQQAVPEAAERAAINARMQVDRRRHHKRAMIPGMPGAAPGKPYARIIMQVPTNWY